MRNAHADARAISRRGRAARSRSRRSRRARGPRSSRARLRVERRHRRARRAASSRASMAPFFSAEASMPVPSGLVSNSSVARPRAGVGDDCAPDGPCRSPRARTSARRLRSVWPPRIATPASRATAAPPARICASISGPRRFDRKRDDVERRQRHAAHGVDVRERVGRGDATEIVRVVHDGREEVDRLDEREVVGQVGTRRHRRWSRSRRARSGRWTEASGAGPAPGRRRRLYSLNRRPKSVPSGGPGRGIPWPFGIQHSRTMSPRRLRRREAAPLHPRSRHRERARARRDGTADDRSPRPGFRRPAARASSAA